MNKFTVVIIIVILGLFGGFFAWKALTPVEDKNIVEIEGEVDTAKFIGAREENGGIEDHVRGNKDSKVVVVEYADFQCPGCASMVSHVDKLYEKYKDKVAFIFRHFPLSSGHPNARAAAAASESAGFQGYFWEMYESLYVNRADWVETTGNNRTKAFVRLFEEIAPEGDVEKFKSDLGSEEIAKKIDFNYTIGKETDKVTATPALYVNGEPIDISAVQTFDEVDKLAEELIEKTLKEEK